MTFIRPRTALDTMLAEIAKAVAGDAARRDAAVGEVMGSFVGRPGLLHGRDCACSPEGHVRHLLHADPQGGHAVVALVWRPGQMSPVHAHRTWCAFGVQEGVLTETFYRNANPPVPHRTRLLAPGGIGHGPASPELIHRLANLGCARAVSIHCYGVGFDRFGDGVNLLLAP